MLAISRRTIAALMAIFGLPAFLLATLPASAADDKEIAQALRAGGVVILLRHGATRSDQTDADPPDFDNVQAQRNLSDQGKAQAKAFGQSLRKIGAPVGKVYTSKYNRAYETAVLAGFKDIEKTADLTESGNARSMSRDADAARAAALRKMLAAAPAPRTDTVLVTHKPNIVAALGKGWSDVKEGEASLFRPENGGYKLLARIPIDEWPRIAAAAK